MYHHHILTRENKETIKKIYIKQTEDSTPGDWYLLLKKDFEVIGVDMDEKK